MNIGAAAGKFVGTKEGGQALLIGVGVLAAVGLFLFLKSQAKAAVAAVTDINKNTPYEGTGVVGTVGHVADAASGGVFSSIGEWLAGKVADITMPYDPNAVQSRKQAVGDNFYNVPLKVFIPPGG